MIKCRCAECGTTLCRFIKENVGGNIVDVLDKIPGFGESRKALGKVIPKEPGANEAFDDFGSGKTFKKAWDGISARIIHPLRANLQGKRMILVLGTS